MSGVNLRSFIFLVFGAVFLGGCFESKAPPASPEVIARQKETARAERYARRKYEQALEIIRPNPDRIFNPYKDFDQALELLRDIWQRYPNTAVAPLALFEYAHFAENKVNFFNQSEWDLLKKSYDPGALVPQAKLLLRMKRYTEVMAAYDLFVERYPSHQRADDALFQLAELYTKEINPDRDLRKAIELYQQVYSNYLNSGFADYALFRMGDCYARLGKLHRAIQLYREYQQRFPSGENFFDASHKIDQLKSRLVRDSNS